MLAEVGDGSMRDALSIMDQAIACCGTTLSAEWCAGWSARCRPHVLEDVMDAVARNSSEDVLRMFDRLLVEGQSPQHFARQMLRFLRNALVAKVAGSDSPVLQISADERARVARVADRFSEEDLARFMQIMLRTHSELGYKQEQRFHLELGLLKLVHAQRLLPLEELLSGEAVKSSGAGIASAPERFRQAQPRHRRRDQVRRRDARATLIVRRPGRRQLRHSPSHRRSRRTAAARASRRRKRDSTPIAARLQLQWALRWQSPAGSRQCETATATAVAVGSETEAPQFEPA